MKCCGFYRGYCTNPRVCPLTTGSWPNRDEWYKLRTTASQCKYRATTTREWQRRISINRKRRHWKGADEYQQVLKGMIDDNSEM